MNVEFSQGSHFFHNCRVSAPATSCCDTMGRPINWEWLNRQPVVTESELIRHVRLPRTRSR